MDEVSQRPTASVGCNAAARLPLSTLKSTTHVHHQMCAMQLGFGLGLASLDIQILSGAIPLFCANYAKNLPLRASTTPLLMLFTAVHFISNMIIELLYISKVCNVIRVIV